MNDSIWPNWHKDREASLRSSAHNIYPCRSEGGHCFFTLHFNLYLIHQADENVLAYTKMSLTGHTTNYEHGRKHLSVVGVKNPLGATHKTALILLSKSKTVHILLGFHKE